MTHSASAAYVRKLYILDDRVLHVLIYNNGDEFLGLDISDHGIAPLKKLRGTLSRTDYLRQMLPS